MSFAVERPPLVCFSTQQRARLGGEEAGKLIVNANTSSSCLSMSKRRKGSKQPKSKKIRLVKGGRIQLRIAGFAGVQTIPSSHLIRYIPSSRLRFAAKKVLRAQKGSGRSGGTGKKASRKGRKGRKGRKSKKTKKRKSKRGRKKKY